MPGTTDRVLIVDDDQRLADLYATFLTPAYDVTTAYSGESALALLDEGLDPDVVFLDRRMPGTSGDEVLTALRERDVDARVAMVTAVDPDLDVIEMPFDDYLVKPVDREELQAAAEDLLLLGEYDEALAALSANRVTRTVLELELDDEELVASDEYNRLLEEIADAEEEVLRLEAEYEQRAGSRPGSGR